MEQAIINPFCAGLILSLVNDPVSDNWVAPHPFHDDDGGIDWARVAADYSTLPPNEQAIVSLAYHVADREPVNLSLARLLDMIDREARPHCVAVIAVWLASLAEVVDPEVVDAKLAEVGFQVLLLRTIKEARR